MDNRRNYSDNDRIVDDILADVGRQSRNVRNVSDNVGKKNNAQTQSRNINTSQSSESNSTKNFSANDVKEYYRETTAVHSVSPVQKDQGSNMEYQEFTIKTRRPVSYDDNSYENNIEESQKEMRRIRTSEPSHAPQKRKKRRKASGRLPMVLILTTLIFTVAITLSVLIIAVGRDMLAIDKDGTMKMVTIPEGAHAAEVAQILSDEGIIEIPKAFEIISQMGEADTAFIPGEYELSASDAYETIINKLTTDPSEYLESTSVTFIEGTSIYDAAQILEEAGVCEAERFIYYFNAGGYGFDFEEKLTNTNSYKFYDMEGYLFPDTYTFYLDSDPESVCMKIYQNFENKMTDEYYAQMDKLGMTLDEVITLASMVQAEAPTIESMKMVASVFENRLADPENFPRLESDPTTYYVEEVIKPNIEISSEKIFEAYDTYQCNGLPAGAIGNPGIDAIEAVLYPADSDYYFFCANIDTLDIYYAETDEEHEENLELVAQQYAEDDDGEDNE